MSDHGKPKMTDLKEIEKPLLDVAGLTSPRGSNDDDSQENLKMPDHKVRPVADDQVSGFTQANYMNPQKVFKNENQSKLDSFLIYFSESAGTK
jgi:hypothetical protein